MRPAGAKSSAVVINLDYYLAVTNNKHGGQRGKLYLIYKEILATPKDKRKKFWNHNEVETKFTFEHEWIKAVKRL